MSDNKNEKTQAEPSPKDFLLALLTRDRAKLSKVYRVPADAIASITLDQQMTAAQRLLASKNAQTIATSKKVSAATVTATAPVVPALPTQQATFQLHARIPTVAA